MFGLELERAYTQVLRLGLDAGPALCKPKALAGFYDKPDKIGNAKIA